MPLDRPRPRRPRPTREPGDRPPRRRRRQRASKTPAAHPAQASAPDPHVRPAAGSDATVIVQRLVERMATAWRASAPYLRRGIGVARRLVGWILGQLVRHRLLVFRASHRVLWWGALAAMFVAGSALLRGTETGPVVDQAHLWFGAGLVACLFVLVFAAERRMRLAAFMLGAGHGAFGLVTWLITQA